MFGNVDQKKREKAHFNDFRVSLADFPVGTVKHEDGPDFRVYTQSGVLGVEHTELYHEPREDGTRLQARETYIWQTVNRARRIYQSRSNVPVNVRLRFSNVEIGKNDVSRLSDELAAIVERNIPVERWNKTLRQKWNERSSLPREFSTLAIHRFDEIEQIIWMPALGGSQPDIPIDIVQERINAKEKKLDAYSECCDELWLLIVAEGFMPSSWFDFAGDAIEHTYFSEFDRTYIFDFQNQHAIQLETS